MTLTPPSSRPGRSVVLITCFNADAPTSGYATRVLQMVESYTARGFDVNVLRFIPAAHASPSWREALRERGARRVFECIAPPISRYELGRRLAIAWCRPLALAVRLCLRPAVVQAEGHEAAAVTLWRGAHALQVADLHGALPEETEYRRRRHSPSARAPRWFHRHEARALRVCDAYLVVSNGMIGHLREKLGQAAFHDKAYLLDVKSSPRFMRATAQVTRQDYGIRADEVVIVYSGGTQAYQRLSEIAGFVAALGAHVERLKFVIFTADPDAARKELGAAAEKMRVLIASVEPSELRAHLRIADFGIIFRDDHVINRVASPTKIWEYLLSGLHVICNRAAGNAAEAAGALDAALVVEAKPAIDAWPAIAHDVVEIVRKRRAAPRLVEHAACHYLKQEGGWEKRFDTWLAHMRTVQAAREASR
ncbi:glycosyltransferase [Caballeronia concitans]|uniref:Putative glycosyl transferase n=1 Tax=Caballeronia concitans TaxID=1777133 RepID=A0A658R243_9BURK|nr:glycosyltransferase [Caballeronia concitans]KIG08630.1 hypothetical protein BurMR1_0294 [Burkholderia sp. MR1]SAL40475.1 putative glycosyl transferase [Caballeronia concitans]